MAAARADLVSTLSDTNYKVHGYDTPKIVSGSIILDEAEPLLEYGDVLSRPDLMRVNFNILLFQDNRNPAAATKAMDEMVTQTIMNLGEWTLTNLASHYRLTLQENGPVYLVSKLSVTTITSIGDV